MTPAQRIEFVEMPACAGSPRIYKAWVEAARDAPPLHGFCTDCTPEYQDRMHRAGRCKYPEVKFAKAKKGELFGDGYLEKMPIRETGEHYLTRYEINMLTGRSQHSLVSKALIEMAIPFDFTKGEFIVIRSVAVERFKQFRHEKHLTE